MIIYRQIKREGALEVFLKAGPLACIFGAIGPDKICLFAGWKECMKTAKGFAEMGYGIINSNDGQPEESDESRQYTNNAEQWDQWVEDGIE
ncbi:MAG: hypothetical protein ACLS8R_10880 [Anaeromassilibacillus sp.]